MQWKFYTYDLMAGWENIVKKQLDKGSYVGLHTLQFLVCATHHSTTQKMSKLPKTKTISGHFWSQVA